MTDPIDTEAIAAKRCVDCGLHPIVDETGLCIECINANTAGLLGALATTIEQRDQAEHQAAAAEAALAEAEEKLRDRYVAAMEAAQRIGDLGYENQALRTRISLAIGRIERGEPGAALTGLQAALVNAEMGDEQ